jgi:FAD/FMN-containing dehydrogenase
LVTPGTKYVTIGGAVAADIHGKNHHRMGSFGEHVVSLELLLPSGELIACSRERHPDVFEATLGGMGLTGVLTSARFSLRRIQSNLIDAMVGKARDLDSALEYFSDLDAEYEYSAAWLDGTARGSSLGRGVVMFGDHSGEGSLAAGRGPLLDVPAMMPGVLLNPLTLKAFNTIYYHRHSRRLKPSKVHYESFFYPLDKLGSWNRLYGKHGFLQYQFVVPETAGPGFLARALETFQEKHVLPYLVVLKKFGAQKGMLSFPMAGYTLALDFPVSSRLLDVLTRMDQELLELGGRLYLAKDSRMRSGLMAEMYPRYEEWLEVKRRLDPENRLESEQSKRLCIKS